MCPGRMAVPVSFVGPVVFFLNHERMGMLLRQTNIHMVIYDTDIPQQLTKS